MNADGTDQTNITDNSAVDDQPVWSPDGTKIAFTSDRAGNFEVYTMNADGSGVTRLTNSPSTYDWQPSWSPDGTEIAFTRDGAGEQAIYTVPASGGTPSLLIDGASEPAWSPDGTRMAVLDLQADDDSGEIYVVTLSTMSWQQITWNSHADTDPEWAPDGGQVAVSRFDSGGDGLVNMEVWTVESHGYNEGKIAGPEAIWPGWSPDGTRVAYSGLASGNWDIYTVPPVPGSSPTRLTTAAAVDASPAWQPAPTEALGDEVIAFTSTRDGNPEIYVMNVDGSAQTRLTQNAAVDDYPAVSPDGDRVAFTSWRDGDAEIYVMNADGSGVTKITDNGGYDAEPTWSPSGVLMFVSDRDGSGTDLWYVYGGSAFGPYGFADANNFSPDWSSNGVVMVSDDDGDNELYTFIPDGTVTIPLTDSRQSDYAPDWAPESGDVIWHNVMFVRGAPGEGDLYQLPFQQIPDPGDPVPQAYRVTDTSQWEFSPSWRGDATWVAYSRGEPGAIATAEIWMISMEGEAHQVTSTSGANYNPDWGPCSLDAEGLCGAVPLPVPAGYQRTVSLDLSGHLVASGKVKCTDGPAGCVSGVPVKLQRKVKHGWDTIRTTQTDSKGRLEQELPDEGGTYRALAKKVRAGGEVCLKATSDTVRYDG
jgi:Tol biopolymer transport system component